MKISIITINLNNKDGLIKTMQSVRSQAYFNIEYIIIDGGSSDGSAEYIYENRKELHYHISEKDKGIYNGMNKGIDQATGDYLLFLNSGDYLVDSFVIQKFIELNPVSDILYGDILVNKNGNNEAYLRSVDIRKGGLFRKSLPHPAMFFKRQLFEQFGKYNESYTVVSDWEFYFRLYLKENIIFKKIDLVTTVFDGNGITSTEFGSRIIKKEMEDVKGQLLNENMQHVFMDYLSLQDKFDELLKNRAIKVMISITDFLSIRGFINCLRILNILKLYYMSFKLVKRIMNSRLWKKPYKKLVFDNSENYWKKRYLYGGNSGAGSYGDLALFKGDLINSLVAKMGIESVIEWGCGDGNQLKYFNFKSYLGYDVSPISLKICKNLFRDDSSKSFQLVDEYKGQTCDLAISLDVIYHLVEDETYYKYMDRLFSSSNQFVIIYSSNHSNSTDNGPHVRHRKFTDWIEVNALQFKLMKFIPNKYPLIVGMEKTTSHADFYVYQKKS